MKARCRGYSLFELMIVLLVLGVLAGVAAPRFIAAISWQRVEAAARRVAADLRMARDEAVRTSTPIDVEFFPDENRYTIPQAADLNRSNRTYEQQLGDVENSVRFISAQSRDATTAESEDVAVVQFDIFGRPNRGITITLGHGNEEREVVLSETGRVTLP